MSELTPSGMTDERNIYRRVVMGTGNTARAIAKALAGQQPVYINRRWGIVKVIHSDGTLTVDIGGVEVPGVRRVASYTPTIGATVMLDIVGTDIMVVSELGPSPLNEYDVRIVEAGGEIVRVEEKTDQVNDKVDVVDGKVEDVDDRVDVVDGKVDEVVNDVDRIIVDVEDIRVDVIDVKANVDAEFSRMEDIFEEVNDRITREKGNKISRGPDAPTNNTFGDIWLQTPDNITYRWEGNPLKWTESRDQGITQGIQDAFAAQAAADAAAGEAIVALNAARDAQDTADGAQTAAEAAQARADVGVANAATAQASADGKVQTFFQTSAPTNMQPTDTGDLWFDTDDSNKLYRWTGTTWAVADDQRIAQAVTAAANAQTTANRKVETFYQTSAPTSSGRVVGDLWVDTDDGNKLYRWSGTAWQDARDGTISTAQQAANTAIANAATAQSTADGKVRSFFQTSEPTGLVTGDVGDLWFDTDDGNKLYRWTGTAWTLADDQRVAQAVQAAATAQSTANSKIVTFYQSSAPAATGQVVGNLWVNTGAGNRVSRWDGTQWVVVQFGANAISASARDLGAITTYYQANAPGGNLVVGDFWVDIDDNNILYRWSGSAWDRVRDAGIQQALNDANTAQSTADGKVRIFAQTAAPTGLGAGDVGDLWIDTDDGNRMYTWSGTAWTSRQLGNSAIIPKSLIARDVVATGTIDAALIAANTITADSGIIANLAITNAMIAAAAISSAKIQDLAVTTAKIADLTITDAKIQNGTIQDASIGNLNVSKLRAGTMTANITLSSRIFTATSGNRAEMNNSGFYAWNSSGSQTFMASSSGDVDIIGTFRSGSRNGRRIIISSSLQSEGTGAANQAGLIFDAGGSNSLRDSQIYDTGSALRLDSPAKGTGTSQQGTTVEAGIDAFRAYVRGGDVAFSVTNDNHVRLQGSDGGFHKYTDGTWHAGHFTEQAVFASGQRLVIRGGVGNGGDIEFFTRQDTASGASGSWVDFWSHGYSNTAKVYVHGVFGADSKSFIIEHPDPAKAPEHMLQHSCLEGPNKGVIYDGTVKLNALGKATVTLPDYFTHLVKDRGARVIATVVGTIPGAVVATRIVNGQFTLTGPLGAEVDWIVKSSRGEIEVEPPRMNYNLADEIVTETVPNGTDSIGRKMSKKVTKRVPRKMPTPLDPVMRRANGTVVA